MSGYIGTQPVPQATQTRDSFTATSGQTSFATGGYTPNFLDVYLNGVKLAAADYTATNGSDVVLASGAATGDILEVVAFTTFTPADLPAGTPSIDDNGDATAITIDSSENVLVGQTTNALADTGHILDSSGTAYHIRDGASPLILNRKSSDGSIAEFYKDGTTVGSIQARSSFTTLQIGSTGTGITGTSSHKILPSVNNARSDNTNDLGDSSYRWKDLYLSGGVYLGGTGAANKLEDYEEGTWTPTVGTGTMTSNFAHYTKVGNQVTISCVVYSFSDRSSTNGVGIQNLPFTSSSTARSTGSVMIRNSDNTTITASYITSSSNTVEFYGVTTGFWDQLKHNDLNSTDSELYFNITYRTDA